MRFNGGLFGSGLVDTTNIALITVINIVKSAPEIEETLFEKIARRGSVTREYTVSLYV